MLTNFRGAVLSGRLSEAKARQAAVALQTEATLGRLEPRARPDDPPPAGEAFETWAGRWLADRRARGLTSVDDDEGRFNRYVYPAIGKTPMPEIARADLERLVADLDAGTRAGRWEWKTAQNVWAITRKAFNDATSAKNPALRVLTANPALGVAPPDRGQDKEKQFLWPSECAALLASECVPVRWARLFALATYLYLRAGELAALDCDDIDLAHDTIRITESVGEKTKARKGPKTAAGVRRFTFEPAIRPLLEALVRERGGKGPLVDMPYRSGPDGLAPRLRKYLGWASVARPELFATTATSLAITFHDLRATGITWMAVRGDGPLAIQQRAGHEALETTQGYIRVAGMLRGQAFGDPFPPLAARLLGTPGLSQSLSQDDELAPNLANLQVEKKRPLRDSNPRC